MPASRVCALVSGGVDSAALVSLLVKSGREVHPLYVRCGYRWERAEERSLRRLLRALASPRLEPLACLEVPAKQFSRQEHWGFTGRRVPGARSADAAVFLPGRNILLLSAAAVFCLARGIPAVALGTLSGNPFDDASPEFFSRLQRALSSGLGRAFRIEAPFRSLSKERVVALAGELPWRLTFSCLSPRGLRPCGRCNKCAERRRALGQRA